MSSGGDQSQQGAPAGLSQSTPLVTIPPRRGVAVPAGNDHPLAAPAFAAASPPPAAPHSDGTPVRPAKPAMMSTPPPKTAPVPSAQPSLSSSNIVSASVSPPQTLETSADDFLSHPSYRTEQLGLPPMLKPVPLPRETGLDRLRTLVERRAWGDVLKISTGILNANKSPHADVYASLVMLPLNAPQVDVSQIPPEIRKETVEIMTLQCNAWLKLRRYTDLATEVERWNFLKQNDATAESPDWLSWSLHILAGQIQQFTDDSDRASDILFRIRERIPKEDALWLASVDNVLSNMFLRQSRWRLALGSLDRIMELIPAATKQYVESNYSGVGQMDELERILAAAFRCEVLSRQGRTLLQIGALQEVSNTFEAARQTWNTVSSSIPAELANHRLVKILPVQMTMNEGLFDFAMSNYDRATTSFSQALEMLRADGMPTLKYEVEDWMGPTVVGTETPNIVYTECVNNLSLCALYTCQMKEAVQLLEGSIREDPGSFLTERTAFNLCTLYELGADSATSARRKRVVQLIAKRFFLHDVGPESFRVT